MNQRLCLSIIACVLFSFLLSCSSDKPFQRKIDFNNDWKFSLSDPSTARNISLNDSSWRILNLPHDWSVEGAFSDKNPAGVGGGALPGGIGWYRKKFVVSKGWDGKSVFIEFDGVYQNSEVWINDHYLGKRPNGYISFHYDLTPYLHPDGKENLVAVKVDNSQQPNARWYSGSGIYRNVRLVVVDNVYIDHWGTYITTPEVKASFANVNCTIPVRNTTEENQSVEIETILEDADGNEVVRKSESKLISAKSTNVYQLKFEVQSPKLWSIETPHLYKIIAKVKTGDVQKDKIELSFGIRYFNFDVNEGFSLNGKSVKIKGVCNHHDLGSLGAAVNTRAIERQLEIMRDMGVNAIRTTHNPPAPELLDLCDKMGFLVMNEMFDMWKIKKSEFDYSLNWEEWHERDLQDFILRDRNHPSVIIWSIGNEIMEQYNHADSAGAVITKELVSIVRKLDSTRPIVTANNDQSSDNPLIKSGALDLVGYNYAHRIYERFQQDHPGKKFIATETTSALATRGFYDMPSDSIRRWPIAWDKPFTEGNAGNTVSAYDHVSAPWGSTHEETWKIIKKHPYLSGMFIWTGFDYLGEPTPYGWPSRSSYFGVVDLAGFPKDAYYMYQSEWSNKAVLHIFPHWNWKDGKVVDIWAYYNNADEVELFLNDKSLGIKKKLGDELHVQWRVPFEPGALKAISRKDGKEVLTRVIRTAGEPFRIELEADRNSIQGDGKDLSFVRVKVLDKDGNVVPDAENQITFELQGIGSLAGVDNGNPVSHESLKGNSIKAFHGLCLVIVKSGQNKNTLKLKATSPGLEVAEISIAVK